MSDTALVRMTISKLAEIKSVSLEEAFAEFYNSEISDLLSNKETGLFTYTPYSLAKMIADGCR